MGPAPDAAGSGLQRSDKGRGRERRGGRAWLTLGSGGGDEKEDEDERDRCSGNSSWMLGSTTGAGG
jgi:hypothetical protein